MVTSLNTLSLSNPSSSALKDASHIELRIARHALFAQILLTVTVALTIEIALPSTGSQATLFQIAWIVNIGILIQTWITKRAYGALSLPAPIFSILLALFTCSQSLLYSFGVETIGSDVLRQQEESSVITALAYFIRAYALFGVGLIAARIHSLRRDGRRTLEISRDEWRKAMADTGIFLSLIGIVPFAVSSINSIRIVWTSGYSSYYAEGARLESPLVGASYYLVSGLILMGSSDRVPIRRAAFAGLLMIALSTLAAGDRGGGVIYLITMHMLWFLNVSKKDVIKARIVTIAITAATVLAIPAIGILRHSISTGSTNWETLFSVENPFIETLRNLGATLFPLVKVVELSPGAQPYLEGASYLGALSMAVPSPVRVGWLEDVTAVQINVTPDAWLMETLGMKYGPGFTPFAEAYLNFGSIGGCIVLLMFGLGAGVLLHVPDRKAVLGSPRLALALMAFALLGFSVRGSFVIVPAFLLRYVLVPMVLISLLARRNVHQRMRGKGPCGDY